MAGTSALFYSMTTDPEVAEISRHAHVDVPLDSPHTDDTLIRTAEDRWWPGYLDRARLLARARHAGARRSAYS